MNISLLCVFHQDVERLPVYEGVIVPDHMLVLDLAQNGHLFKQTTCVSVPHGCQRDFLEHEVLVGDQVALTLEDSSKGTSAKLFYELVV